MSAIPAPTLYALALALNAAVYRATPLYAHDEADHRVLDIRRLAVAITPAAKRAMSGASPEDVGGLRAGLADLLEQLEAATDVGLIETQSADDLLAHISALSRALTQVLKPAG